MNNLLLLPTPNSPFVYGDFARGEFIIAGKSTPFNILDTMKPINDWIIEYIEKYSKPLVIHLDLGYFNTQSSLMITGILRLLNTSKDTSRFKIYWYYYSGDDDIMEDGEDFQAVSKFSFELVEDENINTISIKKTDNSPLVYVDNAGDLIIEGHSQLENPLAFYRPIIKWLSNQLITQTISNIALDIHLLSIKHSNLPYIKAIINIVEALHQSDIKAKIEWKFSNSEMEELGEDCLNSLRSHYYFKKV